MRRSLPALLALLLSLGIVSVATAQDVEAESRSAFERLATCARDSGRLNVMLLMDESGSLPRTDPEAQRVAAAQSAIRSLARLGEDPDIVVELALAGFAVDFGLRGSWTVVDNSTVDSLLRDVETYRDRDNGLDTDFAEAFLGASEELSRRAADVGGSDCRLLLLFTDGDYDVEERTTEARRRQGLEKSYAPGLRLDVPGNAERVEDLGRELLCDGDGLVDRLREENVVLVTIALEEEISDDDRRFLQAMSLGESDGASCGELRGQGIGAYLPATDLAELLAGFGRAANEISGGTSGLDERELPVCPEERCAEGSREFELSAAYEQFHLLANTGAPDVVVELASPETDEVLVLESGDNGRVELGSVDLDIVWLSPLDVAVDGTLPADEDGWQGTWTMTFVDTTGLHSDAVARAQLYLFGGLTPELVGEPLFRMGEEASLDIRIVDASGTPRTPAGFVEEAGLSATVTDPVSGRSQELAVSQPDAAGISTASWAVPSDIEAATVNVSVRLDVVAQTGIALQPRIRTYALSVLPPVTYPSLGPAQLQLTGITGREGEATGTILIRGGEESSGCVWFEGVNVQRVPRNTDGVTGSFDPPAGAQTDCLAVGAGEEREVEVRIDVERVASGGVEGRVQARLVSDASPEVLSAELPFVFDMHRPVDQARRIGLTAALLLIGFLLPLLVLWVLNWWGARYEPLARLRTAVVPVRVTNDRLRRVREGRDVPLSFEAEDFANTPGPDEPVREATFDGIQLGSKVPLFPFRPAHGVVSTDGSDVVASDGAISRGSPVRGKVPFNLARQWIFTLEDYELPEDGEPEVRGTLRTFLPEGPMHRQIGDLVDELARTVPAAAQELARDAARRKPAKDGEGEEAPPPPSPADEDGGWSPPTAGSRPRRSSSSPTADSSGRGRKAPPGASTGVAGSRSGLDEERPNRADNGKPSATDDSDPGSPGGWQPPKR
jgi:hypothetical protein